MKILVINLLRLGDVIMTVPILNGLANSRKDAQIDVLTFKSVSSLQSMLPVVRRWWTIDRDQLQSGLGRADVPMLTSFSILQEQLDAIQAEEYDLIINLTQTHFSAFIAGYLKCSDRLGLTYDLKGIPHFYSPWFRYLDEHAASEVHDVFHHTDIFAHACGLGDQIRDWSMRPAASAEDEVAKLNLKNTETIALQLFTSSEEKNWSQENWLKMIADLKNLRPQAQFVALGSPQEEQKLRDFIAKSAVEIIPAIVSLDGALALLNKCQLLITGDTSIKHLANASSVKVLELCIGWSDWRRTGIYKPDSIILQGREGGEIQVADVYDAASSLLTGEWSHTNDLSHSQMSRLNVFRSHELSAGFWYAQNMSLNDETKVVSTLIERCAWKLSMNRGRQTGQVRFGSEGLSLCRELRELIPGQQHQPMLMHLDFLEKQEGERANIVSSELNLLRRERPVRADILEISSFRKRQIELEIAFQHLEYKTKLIRTLKSNWTESL